MKHRDSGGADYMGGGGKGFPGVMNEEDEEGFNGGG